MTTLYLWRSTLSADPWRPTSGEHSAALPAGSSAGSFTSWRAMHTAPAGVAGAASSRLSLATTSHQDGAIQGFAIPLKAGSISAQQWTLAIQVETTSLSAKPRTVLSLYVWRPSTSSVVGYIYDSDTPLDASDWPTTKAGRVYTFGGVAVSGVQDGDLLCLEVWFHAVQSFANSYVNSIYYGGSDTVTAGYSGNSPASALSSAQTLPISDLPYIAQTAQATSATSSTISAGIGDVASGDLVVACVVTLGATGNPVTGSGQLAGWTQLASSPKTYLENGQTHRLRVWSLVASGSDVGPSKVAEFTAGSNPAALAVFLVRGFGTDLPIQADGGQSNSHASGTSIEAPSITVPAGETASLLLGAFSWSRGGLGGTAGTSPPADMTEFMDVSSTWGSVELAHRYVGSGATGTRTATAAQAHLQCAGYLFSVRSLRAELAAGLSGWGIILA
jgi:hypothetical protein